MLSNVTIQYKMQLMLPHIANRQDGHQNGRQIFLYLKYIRIVQVNFQQLMSINEVALYCVIWLNIKNTNANQY